MPPGIAKLAALARELSSALQLAEVAGDTDRAELLRGELALLEDLALPEAVSDLRLQRITYRAVLQAMDRPLPGDLAGFVN